MRNILILAITVSVSGCTFVKPITPVADPVRPQTKAVPATNARPLATPEKKPAPLAPPAMQRIASAESTSRPILFNAGAENDSQPILQTPRFDNLIARITAGFAMPELDSPLVAQHERWITRNPEYLNRVFERGGKYLYHIVEELESRNMPTELALLPIVESAFNPQALSKAKAAGLWQFIPSTGRIYDLEQNWWMDERRDVIESTRAALDYLQRLYEMQDNDWFLALASYNWGEGAVLRARKRNEAAKKPTDYASLKMPKETQHYVPKLIALRNVLSKSTELGLSLPVIPNTPFFVVIDKEQSIDLSLAAKFAGMTVAEFTQLNPSLHRPVIAVSRSNRIILPADRAAGFQQQLQEHLARGEPLVTWKPYTLRQGETLAALAKRSGVSAQHLIQANSLKRNAQPLPGTTLLAPIAAQSDEPSIETTLARFTGSRVVEKETIHAVYHRVGKKDTLAKIAKRYGVNIASIREVNKLEGEPNPGQRLLIRHAKTQTVVTDEQGRRTVIAAAQEQSAAPQTAARPAPAKQAPKKPSAQKPKSEQTEKTKRTTASQNKGPAKSPGPQKEKSKS